MRSLVAASAALVLAAGLGACSKADDPAENVAAATADAGTTAVDTTGGVTDPGGVVSPPPANGNEAINGDANTNDTTQSAGSNSFTEGQARGHIENAGYSDVTGLTKTPDGMWTGTATKAGKSMSVSVDFKGAVTAK